MLYRDLTEEQRTASGNDYWHRCLCGYAWQHGKHGGHNCGEYYRKRIEKLESAIKAHRDAKGHERCWLNDLELYAVLDDGKSADGVLPPKCEFLAECEKYWQQRQPDNSKNLPDKTCADEM